MKKIFLIIGLIIAMVPFLSGCTAHVVGKFDDYNETFKGTIDLDMQGHGIINVKSTPSNLTCKGKGWITFVPISSYIFGTCKGQKGEAEIKCSDGRIINGEWTCKSCTSIYGTGISNKNENITFYITPKTKSSMKILNNYSEDIKNKPNLYQKRINANSIESLF